MRLYISGAIEGTDDYKERFAAAEDKLQDNGYETINPVSIAGTLPATCTHAEYMIVDLAALTICDAVYMLDGWQHSKGARAEHDYAKARGTAIFYEDGKAVREG